MQAPPSQSNFRFILIGLTLCTLFLALIASPVSALPPRPTPVPTLPAVSQGAYIQLYVSTTQSELWTQIQWQDNLHNWHTVEGWQGTLDASHTQTWWVAPANFGEGLFRWVIRLDQNGPVLAQSQFFTLPTTTRQVVKIDLALGP
jgi:hypothetical protein